MVEEKQYKISEMAKLINVEAHVLRYWEEELQLPIKRNDLGHRYYTQDDVERFCKIKKLKEKGIQLRGIRSMLELPNEYPAMKLPSAEYTPRTLSFENEKEEKSYRLQLLLKGLVKEAVQESNEQLAEDIKESVIKELDYQFRIAAQEQEQQHKEYQKQQEEYFKKLDYMIRDNMQNRKKKNGRLFHFTTK